MVLKLVPVYQLSSYPVSGLPVENGGWEAGKDAAESTSCCDANLRLHPKGVVEGFLRSYCALPCAKLAQSRKPACAERLAVIRARACCLPCCLALRWGSK